MIFRSTCSKPVLLVGNGARTANAAELIYKFARKTDIPVLTTMNGVDLAQDDMHIGFIGTHGNRVANMILNECDLLISVGARLGLRQTGRYKERFAPNAELIRVDIDQYELSRLIKADETAYQMDAKDFMELLLQEEIPSYADWKHQCLEAKRLLKDSDKTEGNLAVEEIASFLPQDPVVAVDVGQNQCWCAQSLVLKGERGRIFISGGYGTMGCGLPFAIGASISLGKGIVYCITGDGGFQMNIQELETVKRENLPIKMLVLNNRVLGKISETQHFNHQNRFAQTTAKSGYTVPDFQRIAGAYGIRAVTVEDWTELHRFSEWFLDNQACLLNIMLPEESLLTPKIEWETCEIKPVLPEALTQEVKSILKA